jgi:tetratricopeptide (TPR) repeat protein
MRPVYGLALILAGWAGLAAAETAVVDRGAPPDPGTVSAVRAEDRLLQEDSLQAGYAALLARDYDAAARMFQRLRRQTPGEAALVFGEALALQKMGQADRAAALYRQVIETTPPDSALSRAARINTRVLQPSAATAGDLAALAQGTADPEMMASLAYVLAMQGVPDLDAARRAQERAAATRPDNPLYFYNLGILADRQGDRPAAVGAYQKVLAAEDAPLFLTAAQRAAVQDRLQFLTRKSAPEQPAESGL